VNVCVGNLYGIGVQIFGSIFLYLLDFQFTSVFRRRNGDGSVQFYCGEFGDVLLFAEISVDIAID
jgi:hypothetical protein